MADFLTRLAERALGVGLLAKPMIPSMFAVGPAIEGGDCPPGLLNDKSYGTLVKETLLVPSRPPSMLPPLEARGEPSHPKNSDHHPESASLEQVKVKALGVGVSAPDKHPSAKSVQGDQSAPPPASRLVSSEDLPSGRLSTEPILVSAEPILVKTLSEPEQGDSPLPALAVGTQTGMSKPALNSHTLNPPPVDVAEEQPVTASTWKPSAIAIRPWVNPSHERVEGTSLEQSASAPESPTSPSAIRVTIGRVEVRAITPPMPQAPHTTPTPVLSLDDYLKQRNEGRR